MSNVQRIVERLPSFYGSWSEDSLLYRIVEAFGVAFHEFQKDGFTVMRAHWADTATGEDLDGLGSLYNMKRRTGEKDVDFQRRVKSAILEYKGGGTLGAILSLTESFLGARQGEVELIDNPLGPMSAEFELHSGDTWYIDSGGIDDETPEVSIFVEPAGMYFDVAKFDESPLPLDAVNPTVTSLETGEYVSFKGTLRGGQTLTTGSDGKATVDDADDVTQQLERKGVPTILRRGSKWKYGEAITEKVGTFDAGSFNSSVFQTPVANVKVRFSWTAHLASIFELKVFREALIRNGVSVNDLGNLLERIKAAGVKKILTVVG